MVIAQLPSWPTNRPAALQRKAFSTSALTDIQEPQHPPLIQHFSSRDADRFRCATVRRAHLRESLPAQITHLQLERPPTLTANNYVSSWIKKGYSRTFRGAGCELVKRG